MGSFIFGSIANTKDIILDVDGVMKTMGIFVRHHG